MIDYRMNHQIKCNLRCCQLCLPYLGKKHKAVREDAESQFFQYFTTSYFGFTINVKCEDLNKGNMSQNNETLGCRKKITVMQACQVSLHGMYPK